MIESNLARQSDYEWIRSLKSKGFETVVYFICTSDIEINIGRVKKRVKEGGHDVPENIITDRYRMALIYLRTEILHFKEAYLIENSTETAKEMAIVVNGQLIKKHNPCPEWVNNALYILERLNKRK